MNTFQQLTYEQRCQISVLIHSKSSQRQITDLVGVSQSTVSRELKCNTGARDYRHKQTQMLSDSRERVFAKSRKCPNNMINIVEAKIRIQWSPMQISG